MAVEAPVLLRERATDQGRGTDFGASTSGRKMPTTYSHMQPLPGNVAGYAVASFVLIAIPGPSVLFVIGRALSLGRGRAIASMVGNAVGVYVVAALVAFGRWAAHARA
jgi:hypothetical protein